jgi:hypothetical protein
VVFSLAKSLGTSFDEHRPLEAEESSIGKEQEKEKAEKKPRRSKLCTHTMFKQTQASEETNTIIRRAGCPGFSPHHEIHGHRYN